MYWYPYTCWGISYIWLPVSFQRKLLQGVAKSLC